MTSEKKLVILTQYYLPEMGAPQSRLYEMAIGLKKLGWDVQVVAAMPNYPKGKIFNEYRGKIFFKEVIDDVPVYRYALYASNARKKLPRIASMLSFSALSLLSFFHLRRFKPQYIFTESPPLTLALTGIILSRITGAKHIMNVSDIWPLSALELGAVSDGFFYRTLQRLERFLYRSSYACTGQSEEIVSYLAAQGSRRAHLFRNGVDTSRFLPKQDHVDTQTLKIVYAGLLGVAQGILDICRNIDFHAAGAEFHIYGDGAEKKDIEEYIQHGGKKNIYLHGSLGRDMIPGAIATYDITLIPLVKPIYGAIPSKIYEAMAAGLPILFTGGGEGARLIEKYDTGWICAPSDYKSMQAQIDRVANMEKSELQHIRQNGLDAARHVFERNIQIEQLHDFLIKA